MQHQAQELPTLQELPKLQRRMESDPISVGGRTKSINWNVIAQRIHLRLGMSILRLIDRITLKECVRRARKYDEIADELGTTRSRVADWFKNRGTKERDQRRQQLRLAQEQQQQQRRPA